MAGVVGKPRTLQLVVMVVVLLSAISKSQANFNFFLTQTEVRRILGLASELYYVRNGVVNDYAMNWQVTVPAGIHALYFTWQSTAKRNKKVLYNMSIWFNETVAHKGRPPMATPYVNVSLTGNIPRNLETFQLALPCTGTQSAEIDVILSINVTSSRPRKKPIALSFKRKKICLEGHAAELYTPPQDPSEAPGDGKDSLPITYYIVSVVAGVAIVVVIIVVVAVILRKRRQRNGQMILSHGVKCENMTNSSIFRTNTPNNNTYTLASSLNSNSYASVRKLATPTATAHITPSHAPTTNTSASASLTPRSRDNVSGAGSNVSRESGSRDTCQSSSSLSHSEIIGDTSVADFHERYRQMEVERPRVRLTAVVQEGLFGRVYRGWIQRDHPEQDQQVLIKTMSEGAPHEELVTMYREGTHLVNLYHKNVLTMVGISFANNSSPFLIYPFHGYQNLKRYLMERRGGHLRASELVTIAIQAAQGLAFLHSSSILHRDIAARNCVLNEKYQLRLTDSALSRDLFPADYERTESEMGRSIKWMAYEAIVDYIISSASDVWSYGVLVWELTTLAQQPYVEVAACEMGEYLRDGYRLAQPLNCPDDLYKVMAYCWAIQPNDRPHAKFILDYLASFKKQLNSFV